MNAFRPAQAQQWNLYGGFALAMDTPSARAELRGWCGLALASLAIAGVFALLIALSRVPGAETISLLPLAFFKKGLVVHVVFSFVLWYLSILGAISTIAAHRLCSANPPGGALARGALWLGYASAVMLFVPGFMDRGAASLNNYIPVIIDPIYLAGLAVLAASLVLSSIRLLLALAQRDGPLEPISVSAINGSLLFGLAMACMAVAGMRIYGAALDDGFFEHLFWGGGHLLQFVNVALLLGAWYLLGGLALQTPIVRPSRIQLAQGLLLAGGLMGPLFYAIFETFSVDQAEAFTWLQYVFAVPTVLIAGLALQTILAERAAGNHPTTLEPLPRTALLCLILSVALFAIGGFLGIFVDGADTRTPAHYHGVIGGINVAFMGLFYCFFLPLLGRGLTIGRAARLSVWFYAFGQTFHSLGLFLAGGYGAPRKTAGTDQGIEALGAMIGLYGMGVGAIVAVTGGVMFIWICARAILRRTSAP